MTVEGENLNNNPSEPNEATATPVKKPKKTPFLKQHVNKVTVFVAVVSVSIGLFVGYNERFTNAFVSNILGEKMSTRELDLSNVQYTYQKLLANYDGELDQQKLIDGASRGLVAAAGDEYTVFLDSEEVEEFNKDLEGSIGGGIGAELYQKDGNVTIAAVLDNVPAEKAGLLAGDVIATVNDENVLGQTTQEVVKKVRGEPGTTVSLGIIRDGELKEFNVTRQVISVPSVKSELRDGILILSVSRFDQSTAKDMRQAVLQAQASDELLGIVLDLRNNGGGYLEAAVQAAGIWLNDKEVVVEKAGGKVIEEKKTGDSAIANGVPTVVLVNQATASASEILAGALRDHGAATIIGAQTYGKGSVQNMFSLPQGNQIKVTIARWYTPKGVNITKQGIKPDVEVVLEDQKADNARDNQLDEAIKLVYDGR